MNATFAQTNLLLCIFVSKYCFEINDFDPQYEC